MRAKVIIPWRDRGRDPRRAANLDVVLAWWWAHGYTPYLQSDGLVGDAQFNRHKAYNAAVRNFSGVDVFIFSEADMLIPEASVDSAARLAFDRPGLIVPFTEYRYLSDETTAQIRDSYYDHPEDTAEAWSAEPESAASVFRIEPESIRNDMRSIGAINVISRKTIEYVGGFCELTAGSWYDDRVTEEGFAFLTNPTRFVSGPAVHLYHLPGWKGQHLTDADKEATQANKVIFDQLRLAVSFRDRDAVQQMMSARTTEGN